MYKISELEMNGFLNDDNKYGVINVYDDLNEMSRFGIIPDSTLSIHIEGGEGYVPHMHICKTSGKNIIMRICLTENKYFREKDDKYNTLNSKERKALQKYLSTPVQYANGITNWHLLVYMWNNYNPAHTINPNTISQPDYTNIDEA